MAIYRWLWLGLWGLMLSACTGATPPPPTPTPTLPQEITFFAWPGYLPEKVMTAFTAKYGITIKYEIYGSEEESFSKINSGNVFDVMIVDCRNVPEMIKAGQITPLDYRNIPNFKNISPNFRNLAHDPDNKYTVPYHWGLTGIVYRSDLVPEPTSWRVLADPQYKGKVGIWNIPSAMMGAALKAVNTPVNTNNLTEIQTAGDFLLDIKRNSWLIDGDNASSTPYLIDGKIVMAVGWSVDIVTARNFNNETIKFAIPQEGTLLWGDNLVVPMNSPHKYAAELLIDFLMQPEINAQLVNENGYATANDAARPFVKRELLNNPLLYPEMEKLKKAEIIALSNTPDAVKLQTELWQKFVDTPAAAQ